MMLSNVFRAFSTALWLLFYPIIFLLSRLPSMKRWFTCAGQGSHNARSIGDDQEELIRNGYKSLILESDADAKYLRFDTSHVNKQSVELPDGSRVSTMCANGELISYVDAEARTILQGFRRGQRVTSDGPCFGSYDRQSHSYKWASYNEVSQRVQRVASGLFHAAKLSESKSDVRYVGCWSQNRAEVLITQIGAFHFGGVMVPLYDTLGQTAVEFIIRQTEMRVIVCDKVEKIETLFFAQTSGDGIDCLKAVRLIVLLPNDVTEPFSENLKAAAAQRGIKLLRFSEIEAAGEENAATFEAREPAPEDMAYVCYTSGTTGIPKGVVLTHSNLIAESAGLIYDTTRSGAPFLASDVYLSYLPMAHVYEMSLLVLLMHQGAAIAFFRGDVKLLLEDLQLVRPTIFCTVPRILNRIYDTVHAKVRASSAIARLLYERGLQYKRNQLENGIVSQGSFYDKLVFKKVHRLLGGRQRLICVGSAPISAEVLSWVRCVMSCVVLEGYGQTETSACLSLTFGGDGQAGHVGAPLVCNRLKLADASQLGYSLSDNRGELCVQGYNCTKGYLNDPVQTRELIDEDGWLHTGDIVEMLPNGTMRIIDRKKHLFKLAQGEYVAPERVETVYLQSPFVGQVFVDGNSLQTYAVAIVVPEREIVEKWARANGACGVNDVIDFEELCKSPSVNRHILRDMQELGKKARLNSIEQVKAIQLVSEPFSVENGLLTPTMKAKRTDIRKRYAAVIDELYRTHVPSH